jgi:ubiquinone/menaquinone biosynthesis C-methylase UbiE
MDYAGITGRQRETWGLGDFNVIAIAGMVSAETLVADVDPRPGQRVLDIACGSGNVALVAARRQCDVVGVDFAENLLARGRKRAEAEGVTVEFRYADAQALPFEDGAFDVVMSVFGVMFAPDQERAAAELLRVTKPGGTIGLSCWMMKEFGFDIFRAVAAHAPPPPGLRPPQRWGTEEGVRELIGAGCSSIACERKSFIQYARSVDQVVGWMMSYFGPLVRAASTLDDDGKQKLRADVTAVYDRYNRATDGTAAIELAYLRTIAQRA